VKSPSSSLAKKVRLLPSGTFATSITATPGASVEYQLSYSNGGPGIAHDVVISDPIPDHTAFVSCSDACTQTGSPVTSVSWSLGDVASGASKSVTFVVKLDAAFPAGTTAIKNVGKICSKEEGCKNSPEVTVTVTAATNLKLVKSSDKTGATVIDGDSITYTLAYSNTGNANATNAKIGEAIPAGSTFVSCTGGCTTDGPPVTTATWSLGTVNAGASGSVTLTVKVNSTVGCQICNTATLSSSDQSTVSSNQICVGSTPSSDPSTAKANGQAVGLRAYVPLLGIPLVNTNLSDASSTQTGPGQTGDDDEVGSLGIVVNATSIAKADVLRTTSASQVTKALGARQVSTAEVLGLDILSGVVTADVVRSVASTTASGTASSFSANGTTTTNLRVLGTSYANASPGLKVPLDNNLVNKALYGKGSYVALNEQTGTTGAPTSTDPRYKADLTVTMVRVYITGGTVGTLLTLGGAPVEITVARSTAHSEHKQTPLCTSAPTQAVSGHAFVASAQVSPLVPTTTVGFVEIPASGGSAHDGVAATVPADGSIVSSSTAASDTTGANGATASTSSSYAQVEKACVVKLATSCLVTADLIRAQANSSATASTRSSNATGTQLSNVKVGSLPLIVGTPAPNTVIPLLGIGFVVLNEQVPDGPETGHTGLTVRGLHLKLFVPLAPLLTGAEVIVAQAHSDATFR
jgi:uncharacterized repeat protein (TIGR01451 family)